MTSKKRKEKIGLISEAGTGNTAYFMKCRRRKRRIYLLSV